MITKVPSEVTNYKGLIPARAWNQSTQSVISGKLPVGKQREFGMGGNFPQGRIPDRIQSKVWRHPFSILPVWNDKIKLYDSEIQALHRTQGAWQLYITPGFIDGHPPAIRMRGPDIIPGAPVWANNYGKKVLRGGVHTSERYSVLLTDDYKPFIKVTNMMDTRSKTVGLDGKTIRGGEVPFFFRARGAYKPTPLDFGDFLSNLLNQLDQEAVTKYILRLINAEAPSFVIRDSTTDPFPDGNRLLYQCDIILQVDRPTIEPNFVYDDIGLLRYSGFNIKLPTRDDYSARIYHVPIFIPLQAPSYFDVISGIYIDFPYDELVLGRFFLLSPTDRYRDSEIPDGTWLPFVRHDVYWNLNYASIQQIDVFTNDTSLEWFKSILSVLAGGVAWLFAVSIVNPIEATYDQINTAFNQTATRGQFWTG